MKATMNSQSARASQLRARAASIQEDIDDMVQTCVHMGESSDWTDPRIERIEADIHAAEALRDRVLARARRIHLHGRAA
jgi:hypothetical protein